MFSSSPEYLPDAAQESPSSSSSSSVPSVLLLPGGRDVSVLLRRLLDVVGVGDLTLLHQLHGLVDVLLQLLAGLLVLLLELAELALRGKVGKNVKNEVSHIPLRRVQEPAIRVWRILDNWREITL